MPEESATISTVPRFYNIVVLGSMNPPIHNPLWYRLIGCITEEEEKSVKDIVILPQIATFSVAGIALHCTQDRWEVGTKDEKLRGKILDVACAVFTKLYETPVRALGFNTLVDLETTATSVPQVLAKIGIATGIAPPSAETSECEFSFIRRKPFELTTAGVVPSAVHAKMVHVRYNSHHDLKPISEYRDLTPELKERFDPHWHEATAFAEHVVNRISEVAGN